MTTSNTELAAQALQHIEAIEKEPGMSTGFIQFHATLAANALRQLADAVESKAEPVAFTEEHVAYIARFGGQCRDCADENGVCPSSGLPCGSAGKAIRHVLNALAYGMNHKYIAPVQPEKDERKPPSPTAGMSIEQRILHVGGRNNAAGYVEFGSTHAVLALVRQVLRDLPTRKPLPASTIVTMYAEAPSSDSEMIEFARAIERAHGIGSSTEGGGT